MTIVFKKQVQISIVLGQPFLKQNTVIFNGSQLAKMKKSIPDMSLPQNL